MTWWEWTVGLTIAPLPGVLVWRWRVRRTEARMVRDLMAERRARFGGAIKVPGQRDVQRIEREKP